MQKCLVKPLGEFGDYQDLLGCSWCEVVEECRRKTGENITRINVKKNKGHFGWEILKEWKNPL